MIKKVGSIIELDPTKKYVMLVKGGVMSENDIKYLVDTLVAQKDSLVAIQIPADNFECIEFVENSDRIIDVTQKEQ